MTIHITPNLLIIVGLVYNIIGAVLISLEAFGIREFIEKTHDTSTHEHRFVYISYVAMINQFSVFVLVNCCWVVGLIVLATFPVSFTSLLFPVGFFVWKFIVKILEIMRNSIQRFAPKYRKGEGCLKLIIVFPFLMLLAVIFGIVSLLHIGMQFGIDLPLRFFAEKVIGKGLLSLFEYVKEILDKSRRTYLKAPSLLGAALLVLHIRV
ncbi:hypothetical protein C5S32_13200 [ANME-1 cluster archaeon GoMg1]|nr:hypothetical protein [ANME-1 cluster archaeon GoMg1]